MIRRFVSRGLVPAILALGLVSPAFAADSGPIPITVSVVPQQWLVDSIGGGHVKTTVMVKPGASPATYEPTPSQMRSLSEAEVYFSIGVPFEGAWLPRFHGAAPDMEVVDMAGRVKRGSWAAGTNTSMNMNTSTRMKPAMIMITTMRRKNITRVRTTTGTATRRAAPILMSGCRRWRCGRWLRPSSTN